MTRHLVTLSVPVKVRMYDMDVRHHLSVQEVVECDAPHDPRYLAVKNFQERNPGAFEDREVQFVDVSVLS